MDGAPSDASRLVAPNQRHGDIMAKADKPNTPISIPRMDIKRMTIRLIGDAPLICHAWSEKAKKEMLDKQMKKAKPAKEAKSPEQDYEESLYRHPIPRHAHRVAADSGTGVTFRSGRPDGGYGFPSVTFKAAAVDACSHVDGITKVEARGAFHING